MVNRRASDSDDTGVLNRTAAGVWKMVIFVASIVAGLVFMVGVDNKLASQVAKAEVEARVGPVEKRLDDHLASSRAMREVMDRYVEEQREMNRMVSGKLDALCRANPKASCPLGGP